MIFIMVVTIAFVSFIMLKRKVYRVLEKTDKWR
jgi:hypothetical protein